MPNADNDVTLRDYIEKTWELKELRFEEYKAAAAIALKLATENIDGKLEHLNESRAMLERERTTYVTSERHSNITDMMNSKIESQNVKLGRVENFNSRLLGMAVGLSLISGLIGSVIAKLFFR